MHLVHRLTSLVATLVLGSSAWADAVKLTLTQGSQSNHIRALDLGKPVKYEYVPSFQSALYAPKPL